jgi:hypothetical protein
MAWTEGVAITSCQFSYEQLQQFGKSTCHPSNFVKTRKIVLQQFGKPTW